MRRRRAPRAMRARAAGCVTVSGSLCSHQLAAPRSVDSKCAWKPVIQWRDARRPGAFAVRPVRVRAREGGARYRRR